MSFVNVLLILLATKVGISSIKKYIIRPNKLKMELIKYSSTDMVKVVDLPDELYEGNDLDVKENEVYKKIYNQFCEVIESKIPREDLDNYYRNFKTLKEEKTPTDYMLKYLRKGQIIGGTYNLKNNTIDLETMVLSKVINSICHELLHAATTRVDKENGVIYSGLSQMFINKEDEKKNEVYGIGINEGLTQYYANKFFDPNHELTPAYSIYEEEQMIAKVLEKIVGEEKLQSFYFRSDLKGFVTEIQKYASKEDIYKFINYTDVLFYYSRDKKLKFRELDEVKKFINMFLIKAYNNSLKDKNEGLTLFNHLGRFDLPYKTR